MKNEIAKNFAGRIILDDLDIFFTVNDFRVKLFPKNYNSFMKHFNNQTQTVFDNWIYGIDENNYCIAIYVEGKPQKNPFFSYISFISPLIIKSTSNNKEVKLSHFSKIKFVGKTINYIHNPKYAVDFKKQDGQINFLDNSEFTKEYNCEVLGEKCSISYSIQTDGEFGNILSSSVGNLNSFIKLTFDDSQPIDKIIGYYHLISELITFCVGQHNVDFNMELITADNSFAICKVKRSFEDDIITNFRNVIPLQYLSEKLPNLLNILSDEKEKPYLLFLPYRNRDIYYMNIANVRDICTSLEHEYNLHGITNETNPDVSQLIKCLKGSVKEFRNNNKDKLNNEFYNSVNSTLKFIEFPAKEQFIRLYHRYQDEIIFICDNITSFEKIKYTDDELQRSIQEFVKLRNNITHCGSTSFEKQAEIYYILVLIVYLSVLERADISKNIAIHILCCFFQKKLNFKIIPSSSEIECE